MTRYSLLKFCYSDRRLTSIVYFVIQITGLTLLIIIIIIIIIVYND